mgnify:CR=1 FL=1
MKKNGGEEGKDCHGVLSYFFFFLFFSLIYFIYGIYFPPGRYPDGQGRD